MSSKTRPQRRLLTILSLGTIAFSLGQTLVIPAIPDVRSQLHVSASAASWLVTAYFLSASIATPLAGRLGDMFGKRRLLTLSLCLIVAGNLISAAGAASLPGLIIGRAIQGLGGGRFPLAYGIMRDQAAPTDVPRAIAVLGATAGIGGGVGLPLGGLLADVAPYAWIFWLSAALGAIAVAATQLVPDSIPRPRERLTSAERLCLRPGWRSRSWRFRKRAAGAGPQPEP